MKAVPPFRANVFRSRRVITTSLALGGFAVVALLGSSLVRSAEEEQQRDAKHFGEHVRPFFVKHCQECHGGDKPKRNIRIDSLSADFSIANNRKLWHDVFEQLESGAMPPEGKPRPSEQESLAIRGWISKRLEAYDAAEGRVVLRRLNRTEYENTLNDLLGIKVNLKEQLPQDGSANGFDNAGAALHTSAFLMERYLEAADTALNLAITNRPKPPTLIKTRFNPKEAHPVSSTMERVYRFVDEGIVCFSSSEWNSVGMAKFYPADGGYYRFRISASAFQSPEKQVTFRVALWGKRMAGKSGLIGYFDAPVDEPKVFEFVEYMEPRTSIAILPYGLAGQGVTKVGADKFEGPGLALQWVEVEGPLYDSWPPENHRRIFGDVGQKPAPIYNFRDRVEVASEQPLVDAERILRNFARRAFRRQVVDEDVQPFVDVVKAKLASGYTFEQAIRAALKGILMAPEFLFLRETPGKLDDYSLASRLSYFLWSTMPDDELIALAEQKKLSQSDVLRGQVERLLQHPKAAAFTDNFAGQWLGMRDIDFTEPSHLLYPEFDHMLKVSMIREVELFFEEILKNDLSLANFVNSDFSMINGRMAKHYGIPGIEGWEFRKTPLPPETHRGGVLTMASVLKVTANGTTTSPVIRGAWVLDRILGTPPSPPPDDVPVLDPDIRGATTIREQLAKHRTIAVCASCHVKMDPPGFALESFDCIGAWREKYRVTGAGETVFIDGRRMPFRNGKKVDPSDVLADGRAFANVDELKLLLLQDKDQLARALTTKLLTYATGAAPTPADRPEIEKIVQRIRDKNYGLRSLVHEVAQSEVFRNK